MSFRGTRVVHHQCDPCVSEPIPMRTPPTGEPCAGEPHARFGGRGRREPFPTPIGKDLNDLFSELWFQDTSDLSDCITLASDFEVPSPANSCCWIPRVDPGSGGS